MCRKTYEIPARSHAKGHIFFSTASFHHPHLIAKTTSKDKQFVSLVFSMIEFKSLLLIRFYRMAVSYECLLKHGHVELLLLALLSMHSTRLCVPIANQPN